MRYDLYISYFQKCCKMKEPLEVEKSKSYFKFKELEVDIDILV